jgi:hypothetical protein
VVSLVGFLRAAPRITVRWAFCCIKQLFLSVIKNQSAEIFLQLNSCTTTNYDCRCGVPNARTVASSFETNFKCILLINLAASVMSVQLHEYDTTPSDVRFRE